MGTYNTFGKSRSQIKAGECTMKHCNVGESTRLADGVYVTYESVIVVITGVLVAEFAHVTDKWGGAIDVDELLSDRNPVSAAMKAVASERKATVEELQAILDGPPCTVQVREDGSLYAVPNNTLKIECEFPNDADLDWLVDAIQRHSVSGDAWLKDVVVSEHMSLRELCEIIVTAWEAGRSKKGENSQ